MITDLVVQRPPGPLEVPLSGHLGPAGPHSCRVQLGPPS